MKVYPEYGDLNINLYIILYVLFRKNVITRVFRVHDGCIRIYNIFEN